jgi:hypothetical protein
MKNISIQTEAGLLPFEIPPFGFKSFSKEIQCDLIEAPEKNKKRAASESAATDTEMKPAKKSKKPVVPVVDSPAALISETAPIVAEEIAQSSSLENTLPVVEKKKKIKKVVVTIPLDFSESTAADAAPATQAESIATTLPAPTKVSKPKPLTSIGEKPKDSFTTETSASETPQTQPNTPDVQASTDLPKKKAKRSVPVFEPVPEFTPSPSSKKTVGPAADSSDDFELSPVRKAGGSLGWQESTHSVGSAHSPRQMPDQTEEEVSKQKKQSDTMRMVGLMYSMKNCAGLERDEIVDALKLKYPKQLKEETFKLGVFDEKNEQYIFLLRKNKPDFDPGYVQVKDRSLLFEEVPEEDRKKVTKFLKSIPKP